MGQVLFAVAGSGEAGLTASVKAGVLADPEDVLADGVVLSELHAANVMTADAAQTTRAKEEYIREEFTVVTLHPRPATTATSIGFAIVAQRGVRGMSQPVVDRPASSLPRGIARHVLGTFLIFAGVGHLSFARTALYAQVPPCLPLNADFVVIASGVVEIALGASLVLLTRWRVAVGWVVAIFFVLVFPGNISQFVTHANALGLDSDLARGIRLLFQPLLVIWALWCTGAWTALRNHSS